MAVFKMKRALITGITGQDGSYLAEFLLNKGYEVYGIVRRASTMNRQNIDHLKNNPSLQLVYGDLADTSSVVKIINEVYPDEIYNLAAQSQVRISFDIPEYTSDIDGLGVVRLLEAIRSIEKERGKKIKFYQASTSEMFGKVQESPQKETTPFYPRSPYGCAKVYGYWITRNYRDSYDMFACNGILFNHESERRGENFVTRKITKSVAEIKMGILDCLYLGNLDAKRDWGAAQDFIEAMWLMLQQDKPDDYVIATGETHKVRDFLEESFKVAGIKVISNGIKGLSETYSRVDNGKVVVRIDKRFFRPAEVNLLLGDCSKAKKVLKWEPRIKFKELVREMVLNDIKKLERLKI